jgi:superfamily II DNA helicase RecQ
VSSISSFITSYLKRLRFSDLLSLSNIRNTSLLLSNILKEFFNNKDAEFRSLEQELLIKSILLKVPYILVILLTNIRKSLSYLLISSLSTSKYTIIILPLVKLKLDILKRAKEFNIPCFDYKEENLFIIITLISIESIVNNTFISLVRGLINNNSLDHIIFDECYLLISAFNYRFIMFRFKEILILLMQFIFLSKTLPLIFEDYIKTDLSLNNLSIIRSNYSRSNISYKVSTYISNNNEK